MPDDALIEKIGEILGSDPVCNGRVTTGSVDRIAALVMNAERLSSPPSGERETLSQRQAREVMNPGFGSAVAVSGSQSYGMSPTPSNPEPDAVREALEGISDHAKARIQDGFEMGATVWRLALEDIVHEATAALGRTKP